MAKIGAQYPCFKRKDKEKGVVLSKLVAANLTINQASGELHGDDALAEQVSEFSSGSIAMETTDMTDENASEVYGCTVTDKTVVYNKNDKPPLGELGYFKTGIIDSKPYVKAYYYPKVKAALGNDNAQTKGSSITFQTTSTTFTVFADENGDWRITTDCATVQEAKDWLNEKLSISADPVPAPEVGS